MVQHYRNTKMFSRDKREKETYIFNVQDNSFSSFIIKLLLMETIFKTNYWCERLLSLWNYFLLLDKKTRVNKTDMNSLIFLWYCSCEWNFRAKYSRFIEIETAWDDCDLYCSDGLTLLIIVTAVMFIDLGNKAISGRKI